MLRRRVPKTMRKVNSLTNAIAREYGKPNPDRKKIAKLAERSAKLLRRIKRRK